MQPSHTHPKDFETSTRGAASPESQAQTGSADSLAAHSQNRVGEEEGGEQEVEEEKGGEAEAEAVEVAVSASSQRADPSPLSQHKMRKSPSPPQSAQPLQSSELHTPPLLESSPTSRPKRKTRSNAKSKPMHRNHLEPTHRRYSNTTSTRTPKSGVASVTKRGQEKTQQLPTPATRLKSQIVAQPRNDVGSLMDALTTASQK